ncbi:MAG TPA: glycosyltransferase family 39 protein [Solirubrobacteraceae bacterium]|nr:glycosyltransferase family 39 protein [Solirubrobacteraceae bacterium]
MSRHTLALLAIVLVAAGIRITYSVTTGHIGSLVPEEGQMAHNIVADGRWFVRNTRAEEHVEALTLREDRLIDPASVDYSHLDAGGQWYPEIGQSVGVGVVIAGLWAITGDERYIVIQVFQGLVDALAALLVYWIALQLFKRRGAALLAAALYALYPPIAWQTIDPYNDIWAIDFTIATTAMYLLVLKSPHRWRWLIVCGLCVGIGAYFRPQLLIIAPALALATVAATGWREALRRAGTVTVTACLLLIPWTIRNYEDFHAFIPTRIDFWETAWAGLGDLPNDFGKSFTSGSLFAEVHRVRPDLTYETPAFEASAKNVVIRAIEQHPLFELELLGYRVVLATLAHEDVWMHRGAGSLFGDRGGLLNLIVDRPRELFEYALQPLTFLLALLGLALTWRRWKEQQLILVALVLCVLLPYIALSVETRYILPADFVYFIWIGVGAELLVERVKDRSRRGRAVAADRALGSSPGAGGRLEV